MNVRKTARLVVLSQDRVLLVRHHDLKPVDPSRPDLVTYWIPPGGGVNEGESFQEAALREAEEETGIRPLEVGPQIWSRKCQLIHGGEIKQYMEHYFVAWSERSGPLENRTNEGIEEIRWWTLEDLRESADTFLPRGFVELVAAVMAGGTPPSPIELSEEGS